MEGLTNHGLILHDKWIKRDRNRHVNPMGAGGYSSEPLFKIDLDNILVRKFLFPQPFQPN
jgi:hypothetical protein